MASKQKSSDAGNLDMTEKSHKVLSLNKKVKVLNKDRQYHMLRLLRSIVRRNLLAMKLAKL